VQAEAEWYDIGSFWAAVAGVLLTVLISAVTLLVTYRLAVPRRRLVVIHHDWPLDPSGWDGSPRIALRNGLRRIRNPYLVELGVGNDGRRPIPGSQFDLDVPVVFFRNETKQVRRRGGDLRDTVAALTPGVRAVDCAIHIGPGMLAPLQLVDVLAVVDGKPEISYRSSVVDVQPADAEEIVRTRRRFAITWQLATAVVAIVSIVLPAWLRVPPALTVSLVVFGILMLTASQASSWFALRIMGRSMEVH